MECVQASQGLSVSSVPRMNLTRSHGSSGVLGSAKMRREGKRGGGREGEKTRGERGKGGEGGREERGERRKLVKMHNSAFTFSSNVC